MYLSYYSFFKSFLPAFQKLSSLTCFPFINPLSRVFNLVQIIILNFGIPSIDTLLPIFSFSAKTYLSLWDLSTVNLKSSSSFCMVKVIFPFFVVPLAVTFPLTLNLLLYSFIFLSLSARTLSVSIRVVSIVFHQKHLFAHHRQLFYTFHITGCKYFCRF